MTKSYVYSQASDGYVSGSRRMAPPGRRRSSSAEQELHQSCLLAEWILIKRTSAYSKSQKHRCSCISVFFLFYFARLHHAFPEVLGARIRVSVRESRRSAPSKVQLFGGELLHSPPWHVGFVQNLVVVCGARGPRPRYPRVWKTDKRIGTVSKSQKLVKCIKGLSNVKEEVYGALDSFVAWELEFPLIAVKKALKTLEDEKEWKRIIQVIKWMFNKGQGKTMGSYQTLLNALVEDGRIEEAEELFQKIFSRYMEGLPRIFFMKMISLYYRLGSYEKMFEILHHLVLLAWRGNSYNTVELYAYLTDIVFADMEELGVRPDTSIVRMLGDVFMKLEMLDKYEKLNRKYPPPKFEYRYIKGKRIRIRVYPDDSTEEVTQRDSGRDELEDAGSMNPDNELEEVPGTGLDMNVLGDAASGDLEFV
ncbi:hypothetical protein TRIUR3_10614 [Triticum urartu]|uniref:Pentatricopeptide repeat-containing protein n=1 Tax=Triticum urartu TaxID=4572 RepID=M7ZZL5_TRIUA|nr:hypothetical protein TRIUR3_10614 [Triticum urartu]